MYIAHLKSPQLWRFFWINLYCGKKYFPFNIQTSGSQSTLKSCRFQFQNKVLSLLQKGCQIFRHARKRSQAEEKMENNIYSVHSQQVVKYTLQITERPCFIYSCQCLKERTRISSPAEGCRDVARRWHCSLTSSLLKRAVTHSLHWRYYFFSWGHVYFVHPEPQTEKWALLQCNISNENPVKPLKIVMGHVSLTFCTRLLIQLNKIALPGSMD